MQKIKNYAGGQNSIVNTFYNIKNTIDLHLASCRHQLNLSSGDQLDQYQNFIFSISKCLILNQ